MIHRGWASLLLTTHMHAGAFADWQLRIRTCRSYEDFLWALENVRSRAFSGPYTGSSGGSSPWVFRWQFVQAGGGGTWAAC